MKVSGLAVVKNEADIIEAFVRHNLVFLDHLHVIDNASNDGTWEILSALVSEQLPISLARDDRLSHPQSDLVTRCIQRWTGPEGWVFCLDADEFILSESAAAVRKVLGGQTGKQCLTVPWRHYVPLADDDQTQENPVRRILHRRKGIADGWLAKVLISPDYLARDDVKVRPGNHLVETSDGNIPPHAKCPVIELAHFPIRSTEQLALKVVTGDWAISYRTTRTRGEAWHWRMIKDRILSGEAISNQELAWIAYDYGTNCQTPPAQQELERCPVQGCGAGLLYGRRNTSDYKDKIIACADLHFESLRHVVIDHAGVRVTKTKHGLSAQLIGCQSFADSRRKSLPALDQEIDFLVRLCKRKGAVVDVDAGTGIPAVALARQMGSNGEVWAFEPDRERHRFLCTNATINGLPQLVCERLLLGGVAPMSIDARCPFPIQLLRIEAAGREVELLAGAVDSISTHRPSVFVCDVADRSSSVVKSLLEHTYRCWWFFSSVCHAGESGEHAGDHDGSNGFPRVSILGLPLGEDDDVAYGLETATESESWLNAWNRWRGRVVVRRSLWADAPTAKNTRWRWWLNSVVGVTQPTGRVPGHSAAPGHGPC